MIHPHFDRWNPPHRPTAHRSPSLSHPGLSSKVFADVKRSATTDPMSKYCPHDPFKKARQESGVLRPHMDGEDIPLILRHKDLREAARDTPTFSSDTPCRVPIPAEENVRSVRQLPIEVDPPAHTEYRNIVE